MDVYWSLKVHIRIRREPKSLNTVKLVFIVKGTENALRDKIGANSKTDKGNEIIYRGALIITAAMQGPGQAGRGKESASGTYRSCQNQS